VCKTFISPYHSKKFRKTGFLKLRWSFENFLTKKGSASSAAPCHILKYFCEQVQEILGKKISLQPKKGMKID
jgi:hypothetical protein